MKITALVLALLTVTSIAHAETAMVWDGPIGQPLLLAYNEQKTQITKLVINSDGGDFGIGALIAEDIKARNISVEVTAGKHCYSSCVTLFMGGLVRTAHPTAKFLVHSPVIPERDTAVAEILCSNTQEAYQKACIEQNTTNTLAQVELTAKWAMFMQRFGINVKLMDRVRAEKNVTLTATQARVYNITTK